MGAGGLGNTSGPALTSKFNWPSGLVVSPDGWVYIADTNNNAVRALSPDGTVSTLPIVGLIAPWGVALDPYYPDALYISNTGAHTIIVWNVGAAFQQVIAGVAGSAGMVDGANSAARFNSPKGLVADISGNIYVCDSGNSRIRVVSSADHSVSTLAGNGTAGFADGAGAASLFRGPIGISLSDVRGGTLYVADAANNRIRTVDSYSGDTATLAGTGASGVTDGPAGAAKFHFPTGVAVDPSGSVYVADSLNSRIRLISGGVVSTLAGSNVGMLDAYGPIAMFLSPRGVAVDLSYNVYVADTLNNRVRHITPFSAPPAAGR